MPKLLSRSKHEESELNSVLQIRNQRKEEQKVEEKGKQLKFGRIAKFCNMRNFAGCEFSQPALQFGHFSPYDTVPTAHLTF